MTVRRLARRTLLGICFSAAASPWAAGQVFVSPGLEGAAGYVSNRTLEAGGEGTAFHRLTPSAELTAFASKGVETALSLRHMRTEFTRAGAGRRDETSALAAVSRTSGRLGVSLAVAAGLFRDAARPEDDARWACVTPSLAWDAAEAWTLSVAGSATGTRYDSREGLDGERQADTRWRLVPGVHWLPRSGLRLWVEAEGELNRSNLSEEEYGAVGAGGGFDAEVFGAGRVGGWVRAAARRYRDEASGEARRDSPLSAGVWGAYRLAPWAELTGGATWLNHRSTEAQDDYRSWTAEGGLRLVYDHRIGGPAP